MTNDKRVSFKPLVFLVTRGLEVIITVEQVSGARDTALVTVQLLSKTGADVIKVVQLKTHYPQLQPKSVPMYV